MGQKFNCDLCFADIPIAENIQEITIGGGKVADACLTCAQQITNGIKTQITEAAKKMAEAQLQVATPAPQPAAPEAPADKEATPQPQAPAAPREGPAPPAKK